MALLDEVIGALVIGAWINCFLYALELVCFWHYFTKPNRDHIFLKVTLVFMIFLDTSNTILQCMTVYRMTVDHFGDMAYLAQGTVFFALQCALPSSTALICQLFLVWRFWKVSKSHAVAAFLCLAPLGAWISAIYATVALVVYTSLEDRLRVVQIGSAWLSLEAASDILIAAALVVVLARYKRKTNFTQNKGLLAKLMLDAARTGSITASIAVGMLLAFLFSKTTNINTGFSYVLGRAYALTLLTNLLSRPSSETRSPTSFASSEEGHAGSRSGVRSGRFGGHAVGHFKVGDGKSTSPGSSPALRNGQFENRIDVAHEVTVHISDAEDGDLVDEKGDYSHASSQTGGLHTAATRRDSSGDVYELAKMPAAGAGGTAQPVVVVGSVMPSKEQVRGEW